MISVEQHLDVHSDQRAEEQAWAFMAAASDFLEAARERGDVHDLSYLSDENLFTVERAITGYGDEVATKLDINHDKVVIGSAQVDAVTRQKQYDASPVQQELAKLDLQTMDDWLDEDSRTPKDVDTKLDMDATLTYNAANNMGKLWDDVEADKSTAFMSNEVDSATYIIVARCLEEMKQPSNANPYEKKAAAQAYKAMKTHGNVTLTERVAFDPESLRRVRLARVLGPKAGDMAMAAVVRHQLAA